MGAVEFEVGQEEVDSSFLIVEIFAIRATVVVDSMFIGAAVAKNSSSFATTAPSNSAERSLATKRDSWVGKSEAEEFARPRGAVERLAVPTLADLPLCQIFI